MKVKVYGHSDDLIEVEGDLREEFDRSEGTLVFGDGTHLHVEYGGEGLWSITRVKKGTAKFKKVFTADDAASNEYSDVVELEGDLVDVDILRTPDQMLEYLANEVDFWDLPKDTIVEIFNLVKKAKGAL